ncbi:hypothetical protein [Pseudarthrobacter sp. S9]|uniref:hypothetical protein n=1 Tax=Pseudarthrobacter sp. S9 TaxID=3418421 RepID=UPI003CFD6EC7
MSTEAALELNALEDTAPVLQLGGQMSINDVMLELGQAPVMDPYPDAGTGDGNFF